MTSIFSKKNHAFLTLAIITTCLLSGCGFHLVKAIPAKHPIYIQLESNQPNSRLSETLISKLKENNISYKKAKFKPKPIWPIKPSWNK